MKRGISERCVYLSWWCYSCYYELMSRGIWKEKRQKKKREEKKNAKGALLPDGQEHALSRASDTYACCALPVQQVEQPQ